MSVRRHTGRLPLILVLLLFACGGGCVLDWFPFPPGDDDNGGGQPNTIRVRVVNASLTSLDPEIYIAATPVTVEQLFQAGNKFTAFGVGTLGLLGAGGTDTFTVSCDQVLVIGTKGGRFGDDLNHPDGTGEQIVLTQDLSFTCGAVITFSYTGAGSNFDTDYQVTD